MEVIAAIGTASPLYKRHQMETAEAISKSFNLKPAEKRLLKSIYKATGIDYRYSVLSDYCKDSGEFQFFPNDPTLAFPSTAERMKVYKENAIKLALEAIQNCLGQLNEFNRKNITHVITISCTGMYAPGIDIEIIQQLKLNSTIKRTAINFMGCYGAFNGFKIAKTICQAEPNANVLVVCVELCTIHFQNKMNKDNVIANAIFADGAAAALITREAQKKSFKLNLFHCDLIPQTTQEMAWHIGDQGFDIELSSYVPEAIEKGIAHFTQNITNRSNLLNSHIDFYAIHPGGVKILEACEKALNLSKEQNRYSYQVLRNYGNMSSATVLFLLKEIWNDINPNDHNKTIFSCAFGPGLTLESMLLTINHA